VQEAPHAIGAAPSYSGPSSCRHCHIPLLSGGAGGGGGSTLAVTCPSCLAAHWCSARCYQQDAASHTACGECALYKQSSVCQQLGSWCREASLALRCLRLPPIQPPLESHMHQVLQTLEHCMGHAWVGLLLDTLQHCANIASDGQSDQPHVGSGKAGQHADCDGQQSTQHVCSRDAVTMVLCQVIVNAIEPQPAPLMLQQLQQQYRPAPAWAFKQPAQQAPTAGEGCGEHEGSQLQAASYSILSTSSTAAQNGINDSKELAGAWTSELSKLLPIAMYRCVSVDWCCSAARVLGGHIGFSKAGNQVAVVHHVSA
jgi:hypothetical protein